MNLAGNALKFTHKGEIFIKGEKLKKDEGKVFFKFSVKDTGIGIPKEKQAGIFESFPRQTNQQPVNTGDQVLAPPYQNNLSN